MRFPSALPLLPLCLALPATAQHGGARSGGFAGRAPAAGFHGSFAAPARPAAHVTTAAVARTAYPARTYRHPSRYGANGTRYPYPYPGYAYPAFGTLDPFWDASDGDFLYAQPPAQPADAYAGQEPQPAPPETNTPVAYAPYPYPAPQVRALPQPLQEEDTVTIFFKDGRQPEGIRNYALTRTALLITGGRMREIPLDQIDLVTTERANRAAGIDFRLPEAN